jgi:hypothetical protein
VSIKEKDPKPTKSGSVFLVLSTLIVLANVVYSEYRLIFSKHDGDDMGQPDWAEDGSFLVFRDLQQLVPEFEKYVDIYLGYLTIFTY